MTRLLTLTVNSFSAAIQGLNVLKVKSPISHPLADSERPVKADTKIPVS